MELDGFKPEFDVRLQGHAVAKYLGPKDAISIAKLYEYLRTDKWRGQLVINLPGNSGVNDVIFTEVRRMSESETNGASTVKR